MTGNGPKVATRSDASHQAQCIDCDGDYVEGLNGGGVAENVVEVGEGEEEEAYGEEEGVDEFFVRGGSVDCRECKEVGCGHTSN